jgi:tetratricopeptide (TPR) repeat protein
MDRAWQILGCAALEGRYFTADAVALTLVRARVDVIDLLDDHLSDSDANVVEDVGFVEVTDRDGGTHHLALYRFTFPLTRPALLRFGVSDERRKQEAVSLARNLERLYAPDVGKIATRLAVLYANAGHADEAAKYRRLADAHMPAEVIVSQARRLMTDTTIDAWDRWQSRRAAAMLLLAGSQLRVVGAFDEVLAFGRAAALLARRGDNRVDEAEALMLQGTTESYMGFPDAARAHLEEGAALWRELRRRDGEAESLRQLGWLDGMTGRHQSAMEAMERAIELWRQLDQPEAELQCHMQVANLALRWRALDLARQAIDASDELAIWGTPFDHAAMREQRGSLAAAEGDAHAAITEYERAASMYRELGETRHEASAKRGVAIALAGTGEAARARQALEHAIVVCQSMENLRGEVEARYALAHLEAGESRLAAAREHLERCRSLYRELGQSDAADSVDTELAELRTR